MKAWFERWRSAWRLYRDNTPWTFYGGVVAVGAIFGVLYQLFFYYFPAASTNAPRWSLVPAVSFILAGAVGHMLFYVSMVFYAIGRLDRAIDDFERLRVMNNGSVDNETLLQLQNQMMNDLRRVVGRLFFLYPFLACCLILFIPFGLTLGADWLYGLVSISSGIGVFWTVNRYVMVPALFSLIGIFQVLSFYTDTIVSSVLEAVAVDQDYSLPGSVRPDQIGSADKPPVEDEVDYSIEGEN